MTRDRLMLLVSRHIAGNLGAYLAAFLFVILGVALGIAAVGVLSPLQRADLLQYLGGFLTSLKGGHAMGPAVMQSALADNLRSAAIVFLLGLSVIGLPLLSLLLVLRGFIVGFTGGFLAEELGGKGYVLVAAGVIPANLVLVGAYVVLAVSAFRFATSLLQSRFRSRSLALEGVFRYGATALAVAVAVVVAAVLEAYVSPFLLSALWPYVGG